MLFSIIAFNLPQPLHISLIRVTFEVFKFPKFNSSNSLQFSNIAYMFSFNGVLSMLRSSFSSWRFRCFLKVRGAGPAPRPDSREVWAAVASRGGACA